MPREIDKRVWYKNVMAIVALIGALLAAVFAIIQIIQSKACDPKPVTQNVEIVLDSSEAMLDRFKDTTKFEAAVLAVKKAGVSDRDNLSFREFGGPCDGDNTKLLVPFGVGNRTQIGKVADGLHPNGKASLGRALIEATGDFNDASRFKGEVKSILVVTAGAVCDSTLLQEVPTRLEEGGIKIKFRLVAMDPSDAQKQQLEGIFKDKQGVELRYANTTGELIDAVTSPLSSVSPTPSPDPSREKLAVHSSGQSVLQILNSSVDRLNAAIDDMNNRDYAAGNRDLEKARAEFHRSQADFDDLGKRQTVDQYRRIYESARTCRDIESQMISTMDALLSQAKANNSAGFHASLTKFNNLRTDYNNRSSELARKLEELGSGGL